MAEGCLCGVGPHCLSCELARGGSQGFAAGPLLAGTGMWGPQSIKRIL